MSRSSASDGRCGSPGEPTASTGQGFGLSWQNRMKVGGQRRRQDGEIALHEARRDARGRTGPFAASDRQPGLEPGLRNGRRVLFDGSDGHGGSSAGPRHRDAHFAYLIIALASENRLNWPSVSRLLRATTFEKPGFGQGRIDEASQMVTCVGRRPDRRFGRNCVRSAGCRSCAARRSSSASSRSSAARPRARSAFPAATAPKS